MLSAGWASIRLSARQERWTSDDTKGIGLKGTGVENNTNWKTQVMVLGALLGALTGVGAAYLLVQRAEREGTTPSLSAGEGVKLGVLVFGLLRQVAQLGE